jgi:predicted MFS family arabinose efflux permease
MAWLTEGLKGKELNREIGIFNRSWMAASMAGPLIAGALYQWNSTVNFIILNLSYFLVLLLLYLMKRNSRFDSAPVQVSAMASGSLPAALPANADPTALPAEKAPPEIRVMDKKLDLYRYRGWIGGFCSAVFIGILGNIVPLHIRDGLGYTERAAGMVLFLRCAAGFVSFSVLARFTSWHFNRRWFIFLQGGLIVCALLFMLSGSRLSFFYVIVLIYGLLNSGWYNNSIFYSGSTGKNPKKNMALHEIFLCMGNAFGTAGGGVLYQHFRFTGVCLAVILLYGIGLWVLVLLNRKEENF